jgi:hypothetical protein
MSRLNTPRRLITVSVGMLNLILETLAAYQSLAKSMTCTGTTQKLFELYADLSSFDRVGIAFGIARIKKGPSGSQIHGSVSSLLL